MARNYKIAVLPGDGTGPEVVAEGLKVLNAAGKKFGFTMDTTEFNWGGEHYLATGEILPDDAVETLKKFDAMYLGAIGSPKVKPGVLEKGILLKLRFDLDQYINLRPVKLYPGVETPLAGKGAEDIDYVVVRENSGGVFTLNPEGAIPLKITLHAYKNVVPKNMGIAKLDENGVSKNFMGLTRAKIWRLIYEIKCEIGVGDLQREITKNVNSDGSQIEGIIFPQVVLLFAVPFMDTMHFDGISPIYGMIDEYDWLLEKDFAEVVKSTIAELKLEDR